MEKTQTGWLLPVLVAALIGSAFYIGRLSSKIESLQKGSTIVTNTNNPATPTPPGDSPISVPNLKVIADKLGLDKSKFNSCLDDGKMADKVKSDQTYGTNLGTTGTPTFFLNGIMIVGALPQSTFEKIFDAELKDKTGDKTLAEIENTQPVPRKSVKDGVGYKTGPNNAALKLVEFTDYQCPFCIQAFPTIKALLAKYEGKISLETRNFPLNFHPFAQKAGEAAECAGEQGKFWEMHDAIFTASSTQ